MAKILVIEDEPVMRFLVQKALQLKGHTILEATDGLEGIQLAEEFAPDLIVCDIAMPGLDGFDTVRAIRSQQKARKAPVLIMTAKVGGRIAERANVAGAAGVINKPIDMKDLVGRIEALLGRAETSQAQHGV